MDTGSELSSIRGKMVLKTINEWAMRKTVNLHEGGKMYINQSPILFWLVIYPEDIGLFVLYFTRDVRIITAVPKS